MTNEIDSPVSPHLPKILLTKEDFRLEASEKIQKLFPDDSWHKYVDETLEKVNADQKLQHRGGLYLNAVYDRGKKMGVAAVRWDEGGRKGYSMLVGLNWEVQAFVNAVLNTFGEDRRTPKEKAARRKSSRKPTK